MLPLTFLGRTFPYPGLKQNILFFKPDRGNQGILAVTMPCTGHSSVLNYGNNTAWGKVVGAYRLDCAFQASRLVGRLSPNIESRFTI